MDRRGFFGVVAGVLTHLGLSRPTEPSYTYCWNGPLDQPWTDDRVMLAKYPQPVLGVPPNRVWLNGNECQLERIVKLKTGPAGWFDYQVLDENGKPVLEEVDTWNGGRVWTAEDFVRAGKNFNQARPGPNGVEYRFETRLKVVRVYGHVRYAVDEDNRTLRERLAGMDVEKEFEEYQAGLRRYLALHGVTL